MGTKSEENVSLVRRYLTDVVADGEIEALDALVADSATDHEPTVGPDVIEPLVRGVLSAADVDVEIAQIVASGDLVAVRAIISGTIAGFPSDDVAAGRSFEVPHVSFYRIEEGRIAETWSLHDGLGLATQLGLLSGSPDPLDERLEQLADRNDGADKEQ